MMASMISGMMVLFSLIIVVVCLLVVRFRIVNSIEEDVMKIGSLKSIGYTSRQIILSLILQYSLLASAGSLLGVALSYPALPYVSNVFEQQSGLRWEQGIDVAISAFAFFTIILIVILIAYMASRRISKLNPTTALRGETSSFKYKRNYLPLEKHNRSLVSALAFKSILQNIKQNIMIIVILIAVTFAGAFGIIMYYNTSVDSTAFAQVPGIELSNAIASLNPEGDQSSTINAINDMDAVRKTQYIDEVKINIDDWEISAYLMDTYANRETNLVYEGRYPESSNEITLAGVLAERLDKKVKDTVTVAFGDKKESFKVVGLSNGASMGGLNCSILTQDFKRLNPSFKQQSLYIYLNEGTDTEAFVEELRDTFDKSILLAAINVDKEMAGGMASYQTIVAAVGIVMLIITLLVITLVLYFVISSSVIRGKRDLGIQKAIGFTTFQLMNQLSISFIIPIFIGTAMGTFLGAFYTNPLLSVMMKGMGVMRAGFIVNPVWVVTFGVAIALFSYILSLLITWQIRRISAYELVTE